MKITDDQVKAAEETASDVYDKRLTATAGAKLLADVHGININSAQSFINDYRHMVQGLAFKRAMSAPATDYFLSKIGEKRGQKSYALAISAVDEHINYYEQINGVTLHRMRTVLNKHVNKSVPIEFIKHTERFTEAVEESLKDTPNARAARLNKTAKLPDRKSVV